MPPHQRRECFLVASRYETIQELPIGRLTVGRWTSAFAQEWGHRIRLFARHRRVLPRKAAHLIIIEGVGLIPSIFVSGTGCSLGSKVGGVGTRKRSARLCREVGCRYVRFLVRLT